MSHVNAHLVPSTWRICCRSRVIHCCTFLIHIIRGIPLKQRGYWATQITEIAAELKRESKSQLPRQQQPGHQPRSASWLNICELPAAPALPWGWHRSMVAAESAHSGNRPDSPGKVQARGCRWPRLGSWPASVCAVIPRKCSRVCEEQVELQSLSVFRKCSRC